MGKKKTVFQRSIKRLMDTFKGVGKKSYKKFRNTVQKTKRGVRSFPKTLKRKLFR